jgi:hypothetical protein
MHMKHERSSRGWLAIALMAGCESDATAVPGSSVGRQQTAVSAATSSASAAPDAGALLNQIAQDPSSLELTLRWVADAKTIGSGKAAKEVLGDTADKKSKFFEVEYLRVPPPAEGPAPIWRRRTEVEAANDPTAVEVQLDFKVRDSERPKPATCKDGWKSSQDIDSTRNAVGQYAVKYSTGCEKKSPTAGDAPPDASICAARFERVTITTTELGQDNGKVRLETWHIGDKVILEMSAQAETVDERQGALRTFEAAVKALLAKGIVPLDESKTELTMRACQTKDGDKPG